MRQGCMGREKGVHAIFGTQGLADLQKKDPFLKDQIMNCVNTLLCHRLNDHNSAEDISNWIGTQDGFSHTTQINAKEMNAVLGTVSKAKEFIVHPDYIKQKLKTGEAYYVSKVNGFKSDLIKVKFGS